jgi:nucleoside-diphosphate-sugar epimerase
MANLCLVTGANGFVGRAVTAALRERGAAVRGAVRASADASAIAVGNIGPETDWRRALDGVDCVVHTAARVHAVAKAVPESIYRQVNVEATAELARQAAECGASRLVFLSTIKVNGEATLPGRPFTEQDEPAPEGAYAVSKVSAERELHAIAAQTGLEVVIVRPVLVYGPGVKGNFASMLRWLYCGVPLPLGAVQNRRSLVGLGNLVSLISSCVFSPAAANQTFLVSDDDDLATTDLLKRAATALGCRPKLLPVPGAVLEIGATLLGKRAAATRLLGSLQVDVGKARAMLGWAPPMSVDEELMRTAREFLRSRK